MCEDRDNQELFPALQADCENCFGLCRVALLFAATVDFALNKEAGQPCRHLQLDFRCGIHRSDADLRGANLTETIFLTQAQINAAKGDAFTKLPPLLVRPKHWSAFG